MAATADQEAIDAVAEKFRRGDLVGARADCNCFFAAVTDSLRQAPLRFWLGAIEQRGGALSAAVEQFELALQADRHNLQYLLQLGTVHLQRRELDRAESCYREAIRLDARLPLAHYNLGVVLQQKLDLAGAQSAFEAAILHRPNFPEALTNLANVLVALGSDDRAAQCYGQAIAINPGLANAHHALGLLHRRRNRREAAMLCFDAAVRHGPEFVDAWLDLAELHFAGGNALRAVACVEQALKHEPANETARFKRAQYGGEQPAQIPHEVVARLYAGMASTFDNHLVEHLDYRTPSLLIEQLKPWLQEFAARGSHGPAVLDLGCGTGLFGVAIRSYASTLAGVDLSAEMLAKAADRGIYDELSKSDFLSHLQTDGGVCELIAASDVLIYTGNLEPLFGCIAARLPVEGVFAFSVESPRDLAADYRLESSGRFSHRPDYIRRIAASVGLEQLTFSESVIRTEAGAPIRGCLFTLKKSVSPRASSASA